MSDVSSRSVTAEGGLTPWHSFAFCLHCLTDRPTDRKDECKMNTEGPAWVGNPEAVRWTPFTVMMYGLRYICACALKAYRGVEVRSSCSSVVMTL